MKRNNWLIVYVTTRSFPLLINLVLAGKILVISLAVNHWSRQMARGVSVCAKTQQCGAEIDVVLQYEYLQYCKSNEYLPGAVICKHCMCSIIFSA